MFVTVTYLEILHLRLPWNVDKTSRNLPPFGSINILILNPSRFVRPLPYEVSYSEYRKLYFNVEVLPLQYMLL